MSHARAWSRARWDGSAAALADLAGALMQEQRLIEELRRALLRQRAALATDDPDLVDESVSAIARMRLTLEEARRRRAYLESFVGVLPAHLLAAREGVRRAAEATARELAINQWVACRAREAGDAFLQELFSSASETMGLPIPSLCPVGGRPSDPPLKGGTR